MAADPKMLGHFIFNSDYPVDKVVWLYEGQLTASGSAITSTYIDMEEIFGSRLTIFVKGACTLDNWATSIMIGARYSRPGEMASMAMNWTNYNMQTSQSGAFLRLESDFRSHGGSTVKYRLWGVVRDDVQQAVDYSKNTAKSKTKLKFNTEFNYPRLYKDGVAKSGETVRHDLGKIPYVDYWYITQNESGFSQVTKESISRYWSYGPHSAFGSNDRNQGIRATDSTLTFRTQRVNGNNGIEDRDVFYYYRIYA